MSWMNDYTIQETMDLTIYPYPNLKRLPSPSNVRGYHQTWYWHSFQPRWTNTLKGKLSIVGMLVLNGLFIKARLYHIFHAVLFFKIQFGQQFVDALVSLNFSNSRGDEMHSKVSVGLRDIDQKVLKRRSFGACFIENGLTYRVFGSGATIVAATATVTTSHQKQKQQHNSYDHRQRPVRETAKTWAFWYIEIRSYWYRKPIAKITRSLMCLSNELDIWRLQSVTTNDCRCFPGCVTIPISQH